MTMTKKLRGELVSAVHASGGITRASRLTGINERVLRRAMNDDINFRPQSIQLFKDAVDHLKANEAPSLETPRMRRRGTKKVVRRSGESKLDRIERKLDLIIQHLGLE